MTTTSKKATILKTAVEIFRKKGKKTTISEIGSTAGVTDSIIYHYFKNKDDLLYYAAGVQVQELTDILMEHLGGIKNPVEKIRKFIWVQLHYHDKHPNYTNLTIFECRSKLQFFRHESFQHFRHWTRIMTGVLKDGVRSGIFNESLSYPVTRDAIFGLLDMESIHSLAAGEISDAHHDLEEIMSLILPFLLKQTETALTPKGKADIILRAAEHVFSTKGFDASTISEIALQAGVGEGTLYDYFKNKEDLLFSAIANRLEEHSAQFRELSGTTSPLIRLTQIIQHHFFIHMNQPEFMKMFIFEGLFNKKFYQSGARNPLNSYTEPLLRILDEGKQSGIFRKDVNNRIFKNLFLGLTSHMALRWHFLSDQHRKEDRFSEINEAIRILTRAIT